MPIDLLSSTDSGGYSSDPSRPDYACPAYREMAPRWALVDDVRAGTEAIRAKRTTYLPKFEAETPKDWDTRVLMTFAEDHYATTLTEHVGLVMAEPITLGDDVLPAIEELCEDIDGEGNHLDVFAHTAFDAALHYGHVVLVTDYPEATNIKTKRDAKVAHVRPYVQLYPAPDVLCPEGVSIGGVKVLTRIMLREHDTAPAGEFGLAGVTRYRELRQAVEYDEFTGRARSLGAITWRTWRADPDAAAGTGFTPTGEGAIIGPARIPARVVYGGEKLGFVHTKPHLYGLALANLEETQVKSDYANVMHKTNVPTPIFIGRNSSATQGQTLQMGQGIDIPIGGDAKMLEPSGAAIGETRLRLAALRTDMQRQGASTAQGEGGKTLTATEAAQYAKARNAKLRRSARSLQDALEGVLADMAAFLGIATTGAVKSGGSLSVCQDFTGEAIDPAYLTVLVAAYKEGTLSMEELRAAIHTGKLPDDFKAEDSGALIAAEIARQDQAAADAAAQAARAAPPPTVA